MAVGFFWGCKALGSCSGQGESLEVSEAKQLEREVGWWCWDPAHQQHSLLSPL